jgi:hypothetical protein
MLWSTHGRRFPVTEQPATEAPATEAPEAPAAVDALVAVAPTTVITQYEVLIDDIKEARTKAAEVTFDLTDKKGIAAAKSYVFSLRRLNGRIDEAHKEAKAETLERGKAIDRVKNVLREQVAALIQPHQDALDAIAKAEAERVAKHRLWISTVQDLARVPFGSDSESIKGIMLELDLYEQSVDLLEEFTLEGKAALVDTTRVLRDAHTKALTEEAAAAELARLREEARLQAEKDAAAKAAKDAQDAAAEVARKAQEAADAAALQKIKAAEAKAAAAQAEAATATQRALDAEAVADLLQLEALLEIKPAEVPSTLGDGTVLLDEGSGRMDFGMARFFSAPRQTAAAPATTDAEAMTANDYAELTLRRELDASLAGRTRLQVVDALIDGTLHHAIKIDWAAIRAILPTT